MTKITFYGGVNEIGGNKIFDFIEKATEITQIIALTIFAPFAFFAVRCLCYSNGSPDTNTKGN
ncbi:MAG: hypothetical protein O8C64_12765 [Candidatus Methanoperedens sp.]|nr:hypothetical protein [Candidatus Methanoperedens sp.]MCZ7403593.1 hypothetical protein [Candidatus Methanoperedens sp.]